MPQREFWTERYPCEFVASYRFDPTKPETNPHLTITIRDQAAKMMEVASVEVPLDAIEEAVAEVIKSAWYGYLYGDRWDACRAAQRAAAAWRVFSRARRLRAV